MINVLLVDDHEMVRLGVSCIYRCKIFIEVMDEAKCIEKVLKSTVFKTGDIIFDGPRCSDGWN